MCTINKPFTEFLLEATSVVVTLQWSQHTMNGVTPTYVNIYCACKHEFSVSDTVKHLLVSHSSILALYIVAMFCHDSKKRTNQGFTESIF